tara:strand:+ start:774 stop:1382 length:609 start_codon:yes stop_codon:yes gene_type:complete
MTSWKHTSAPSLAFALALILSGCGQTQTTPDDPQAATNPTTETEPSANALPAPDRASADPATTANERTSDLMPAELTAEAERGDKGARNLLLSFGRAIELGKFEQAWAMLGPADQKKWSKTDFAALFADMSKVTVSLPDGTIEGAAGSLYYSAPVIISSESKDGRPLRIEGKAVLRRVNDVDGATPAQLRWHFQTLTLDWTH